MEFQLSVVPTPMANRTQGGRNAPLVHMMTWTQSVLYKWSCYERKINTFKYVSTKTAVVSVAGR